MPLAPAAALVVALALGESKLAGRAERAPALDMPNAARARIGLLPRKAPMRATAAARTTRSLGPRPTILGEPGTLADAGEVLAPPDPRAVRVEVDGLVTDVTLSMRFPE